MQWDVCFISHPKCHANAWFFPIRHLTGRQHVKPTVLWQTSDKGFQVFRLIKTSASLFSLITPHKDPWVASMSTLRLKWMFTSPNDYLSPCWVNATASVLSAAQVTHTQGRDLSPRSVCQLFVDTRPFASCYYFAVDNDRWTAWWLSGGRRCF